MDNILDEETFRLNMVIGIQIQLWTDTRNLPLR